MAVSMVAPKLSNFDLWVHPLGESDDDGDVVGFLEMLAQPLQATTNGASLPHVISVSYGECEATVQPYTASRTMVERQLAATAALGITVVVASGDTGSSACARGVPASQLTSDDKKAAGVMAGDRASVLAVGGTNLTLNADNTIASSGVWNDTSYPAPFTQTAGGGGGLSTFVKRPWWQPAQSFTSSRKRMVPDVAAFADASPGYPIVCSKGVQSCPGSGQSIAFVGGTSAAAPLVAGMIALWKQQARNQGLPKPGFVAPLLYTIAQNNPQAFVDITQGTNAHVRRLLLLDPAGLRPGHRLGLAGGEHHRLLARPLSRGGIHGSPTHEPTVDTQNDRGEAARQRRAGASASRARSTVGAKLSSPRASATPWRCSAPRTPLFARATISRIPSPSRVSCTDRSASAPVTSTWPTASKSRMTVPGRGSAAWTRASTSSWKRSALAKISSASKRWISTPGIGVASGSSSRSTKREPSLLRPSDGDVRVVDRVDQQDEAERDADRDAREDVDQDHPEQGAERRPELERLRAPVLRDPPGVDHPRHRPDHDRAEDRLRQVGEQPGEEEDRQQRHQRGHEEGDGGLRADALGRRRRRQPAGDGVALQHAGADVRGAVAQHLAVRVDGVVVLRGVALGDRERLGEPHDHDRQRAREHVDEVARRDARERDELEARRHVSDDRHAVVLQVERLGREHREDDHDDHPGELRREAREPEQRDQADDPDGDRRPLPASRRRRTVFTSTDSVSPDGFSIPTTFGSWPIAMYRPSPTMKPSSTGRAKKRATKPIRARPPAT